MSTNGKGSARRGNTPAELKRFAIGWELAFGKKKKRTAKKPRC